MAKGTINKVILIGRLGADPDVRYMPNGDAITNISMATNEQWKDRNSGQTQEHTEWHRITFFRKIAEIAGQYLRKGARVYIEGKLRTNKWQDQSGQDRYSTNIIADQMEMLDSRGSSPSGEYEPNVGQPAPRPAAPRPAPNRGYEQSPRSAPPPPRRYGPRLRIIGAGF